MAKYRYSLLFSFALVSILVFAGALLFPAIRSSQWAYAPLREWILPPPRPFELDVLYSTEKDAWIKDVAQDFHGVVAGRPISLNFVEMGSREIYLSVLDGAQPDLISPASSLQIEILQDLSRNKFGKPIVHSKDQTWCRSVVKTPLVLVAWEDRAKVLWGNTLSSDLWQDLQHALVDPEGWGAFQHPEWGYVKFGQTNPLKSNSGFMTILLLTYDYFGRTSQLTTSDILSNASYQKWFLDFQKTISNFGDSTGTYMRDIVAYGPSAYDFVAVYEATAIEQAENAVGRYGALHIYYPPATVMSDHPFCVLDADWVTPEQNQAAQIFVDYLLSREVQETALMKYGFRPTGLEGSQILLNQPGSPFERYQSNGIQAGDLPVEVEIPSGDVLNTLLEFWNRNISP
jgi:hypothetical protein